MNIVFLDAFTSKPEQLDLSELKTLGCFTSYDRTPYDQTVERAKDAEVILTNKAILDEKIISQLPNLKYIGVTATGYNVVDLDAAKKHGIVVTNAKNYSSMSVAQHVFAMILRFTNSIAEHNQPEKWVNSPDFCFYDYTLTELAGKTIGLVGIGDIGEKVAQVAQGFEMNVLVNRKSSLPHPVFQTVDLDELLEKSDFVSLHCPLTDENEGFMNASVFAKMKPSAILINTGRGPLINDIDLREALEKEVIAGAAVDVVSVEPPKKGNPLFGAKNLLVSPHIAWATLEARRRLFKIVTDNIKAWQKGDPINVVN
ncbi:D-2-hydroxyacid dehydrogenase [Jiulongibacter sediminis]|uniref:Glycerate dehydrogenase n=1 Tax=Jiulongibacter sediminis TaxID=1605367 RepID=A0A0P7BV03_9BACT|nr:D-2-hydroxyacid dehydrogenase [Jiulongibacter sediminis]KPM48703.1 glycerate dehydrogenase [Jiulongibacter sediminis]TBX25238.1 glycerate dehydrogenase [Jiulongibacter sediminis]